MKNTKRIICLVLSLLMLSLGSVQVCAINAPRLTQAQWDELYASQKDKIDIPTFCIGTNETEVSLCWHAPADEANARVLLAKNEDMTNAVTFTGVTTEAETDDQLVCRVTITGLEPNTTYYYCWDIGGSWSNPYEYSTEDFSEFKAVVVGDIQIGGQSQDDPTVQSDNGFYWNNLLAEIIEENPDVSCLISSGDNTSTGKSASEWQTLLMPEALRSLPGSYMIGNHDKKGFTYNYYTNMPNEYYGKYFTELDRDYWFRYGDVLFLIFDATSGSAADHMAMAKEAVSLNQDAKWRIGMMHQPVFGAGASGLDPETALLLNAVFCPIFDTFDIDVVMTGHSHLQSRSNFIWESNIVGKAESGESYTDPKGTIYLNSNAVCDHNPCTVELPYTAYTFFENDVTTYTTLEFSETDDGNTLKLKTFRGDDSTLLDNITLVRTQEHNEDSLFRKFQRLLYKFVEVLGLLYMRIDEKVVELRGGHY